MLYLTLTCLEPPKKVFRVDEGTKRGGVEASLVDSSLERGLKHNS